MVQRSKTESAERAKRKQHGCDEYSIRDFEFWYVRNARLEIVYFRRTFVVRRGDLDGVFRILTLSSNV